MIESRCDRERTGMLERPGRLIRKMKKPKAEEGMRVHVYSPDLKTDLGEGTIEKVEQLYVEELLLSSAYPSQIVLDSGEVTEGLKCWWIPVSMDRRKKNEKN